MSKLINWEQIKNKLNNSFFRNISTLLTGTTIAQAIPILMTPVLTRLYTPTEFGLLGIYVSILSVFSVVINGRYDMAIVLPESKKDAQDLLKLSLYITFIISISLFVINIFYNEQISEAIGNNNIAPYLYLIPVSLICAGVFQSFNQWSNREKEFKRLAVNRIFQSTSLVATQAILGMTKTLYNGLIIGEVTGKGIASFRLAYLSYKTSDLRLFKVDIKNIIRLAGKYKNFPIFSTWSSFFNVVSLQLPIFIFTGYFSPATVGYYTISNKALNLPMNLIGTAVSQVFYQQAARSFEKESDILRNLTLKTFRNLLIIASIPMALISGFGDVIFGVFLGENWIIAGQYARLLAPSVLFVFCTSAITSIYFVLDKQKTYLFFDILLFICRISGLMIGILFYESPLYGIAFYSLFTGVSRIVMLLYTMKIVNCKIRVVLLIIVKYFIIPFSIVLLIRYTLNF